MADLSDEILMAYADGELDAAESARVEVILKRDSECRVRLEIFKATGRSLMHRVRTPFDDPVPKHLVDLVMAGNCNAVASPRVRSSTGAPSLFIEAIQRFISSGVPRWQVAAACTTTFLFGAGASWLVSGMGLSSRHDARPLVAQEKGRIFADGALQHFLETAPSGRQTIQSDSRDPIATLRVRLTFKSRHQTYCRHYEIGFREGDRFAGIGCRDGIGRWHIQMHTQVPAHQPTENAILPADGGTPHEFTAVVRGMMDGDPLDHTDEAGLIARKWQP